MKFKSDIEIQAGVEAGGSTGSNEQVLSSTGSGVAWIDQNAISAGNAEHVVIYAKNTHTASIAKGTPVYITGTVGATDTVQIAPADASDSAKMPAVGLLNETLAVNAFGYVITGGFMDNITTDPIDGATPSSNDTVYVKAGGGLTLTKPTGPTGLIQNVAKVGKVSGGNSGSLIVSSILRTNDVPNLTTGKIWVGDGNTVESTVVHLDEANGRMGIGTTSPTESLSVFGRLLITTNQGALDNGYFTKITSNYSANPFILESRLGVLMQAEDYGNSLSLHSGNAERVRINGANGNVGIGTTSPDKKLEVSGDIKISGGDYNGLFFENASGTTKTLLYQHASYDALVIKDIVNNADRVTFKNNGNVGIGTTSPASKLQVSTATNVITPLLTLHNSTATNGSVAGASIDFVASSDIAAIGARIISTRAAAGAHMDLRFHTQRDQFAMIIDTSGNVGIGTTSPNYKLQVAGKSYLSGGIQLNSGDEIDFGNSQQYITGVNNTSLTLATGGSATLTALDNGNVGIGITSPSELLHLESTEPLIRLDDTNSGLHYIFGQDGDGFKFTTNNPTYGKYTFDTNVGIGTTSPGEPLTVKTKTAAYFPGIKIEDYNSSMGLYVQNIEGENSGIGTGRYYNSGNWRSDVTAPTTIRLDGGAIRFYAQSGVTADTNYTPTQRMTINADGNVGIGTTSPSNRLQVSGGSIGIDSEYMIRDNRNNTILLQSASTAASNRSLTIGNATYSNIIIPNGNVGIGTTSPASKLDVQGGMSQFSTTLTNNEDWENSPISINERGQVGSAQSADKYAPNLNFHWAGRASKSLWLNSTGVLHFGEYSSTGIPDATGTFSVNTIALTGTGRITGVDTISAGTDATSKTYVDNAITTATGAYLPLSGGTLSGNLTITKSSAMMKVSEAGGGDIRMVAGGSTGYVGTYNNTSMQILQNGSNAIFIDTSKNIGIGTTSPGAKLHIGGLAANSSGLLLESPTSEVNVNFNFIIGDTSLGLHSKNLVIKGSSGSSDIAFSPSSTYPGLMVLDGSAGNVGIGTTSPGAKLDVAAVTNAVIRLTSTGNGLGADTALGSLQFYGNDASAPGAGVKSSIVAKTEASLGDDSNLIFSTSDGITNNVERMRIAPDGNVGIGTITPSQKLTVEGNIELGTGGYIYGDTTTSYLRLNNAIGSLLGYSNAYIGLGPSFVYNVGGSEKFRISSATGNVGIGTTSPGEKLDVAGKVQVTGTSLTVLNASDPSLQVSDTDTNYKGAMRWLSSDNVLEFYTRYAGTYYTSNLVLDRGNVGIGVVPADRNVLDIRSDDTSGVFVTHRNNDGFFLNRTYADYGNDGNTVEYQERIGVDGNRSSIGNFSNHTLGIKTNNQDRITVLAGGNVGINNTNPEAKLDVRPDNGNGKVLRVGNYSVSTYSYSTQADATIDLTCGSYYQAEVIITANQTNGGDYNNIYIRGIWSNNHTTHHWDEIESIGFLTGSSIGITVGEDTVSNSGKLSIDFNYTSQSFSALNIKVTDFYNSHSYSIS